MRQENWSVRKLRKLLDNKIEAVENVMRGAGVRLYGLLPLL